VHAQSAGIDTGWRAADQSLQEDCGPARRLGSSMATTITTFYLSLYVFCGEHLLCAKLRPADIDAAGAGKVVAQICRVWPQVRIILRGDRGFCSESLLSWCE
jgi:hypothetical protein